MKNVLFLFAALILASSCSKHYTCVCTTADKTEQTSYKTVSKKRTQAVAECYDHEGFVDKKYTGGCELAD